MIIKTRHLIHDRRRDEMEHLPQTQKNKTARELVCKKIQTLNHPVVLMTLEKYATLALINGKIISVDSDNTVYEAVAVIGNTITTVGTTEKIKHLIGPETKVVELDGKTVLPGFIDSHVHLIGAGRLAVKAEKEVDIKYCDSIEKSP